MSLRLPFAFVIYSYLVAVPFVTVTRNNAFVFFQIQTSLFSSNGKNTSIIPLYVNTYSYSPVSPKSGTRIICKNTHSKYPPIVFLDHTSSSSSCFSIAHSEIVTTKGEPSSRDFFYTHIDNGDNNLNGSP